MTTSLIFFYGRVTNLRITKNNVSWCVTCPSIGLASSNIKKNYSHKQFIMKVMQIQFLQFWKQHLRIFIFKKVFKDFQQLLDPASGTIVKYLSQEAIVVNIYSSCGSYSILHSFYSIYYHCSLYSYNTCC